MLMRRLVLQWFDRCAASPGRLTASVYAAPLPTRLSVAGLFVAAGMSPLALGREPPYALLCLAVGMSAMLGGIVPGVFATLSSALLLNQRTETSWAMLAPYLATGVIFSLFAEGGHRVRSRPADLSPPPGAPGEQLAHVALAAPGVIGAFYVDANGHVAYRYVSPKSRPVFGLDPEEICADAGVFFKRLHEEDLSALNEGLFRSARELSLLVVEFRFDHPENGTIWLEAQAAPLREPDGLVVWHGYASDITSRKRAELALAESAARLQATIDAAQDAVLTMSANGQIKSANRAGAVMFGYDVQEIVGVQFGELIVQASNGDESIVVTEAGESREVDGRRKNGATFPASVSVSEATIEAQSQLVAFIKDLTRQRKIQEHLDQFHQNRLDAMGGMAAALAHEINQPLAANATYLRVARRLVEKSQHSDQALVDILDKAAEQTLRAGRIVTNIKDLLRRDDPDKTLVRLHDVISQSCDGKAARLEYPDIKIGLDLRATRDCVVADQAQLRQVLAALIRNASEAMRSAERRELTVSTANPDDGTIRVDVIDSGCGLPESYDGDCFEPLASTKAGGMGVGLSISRSIMEAHYGRIWATPNAGGGAVFSFALPLQHSEIDV